MAKIPDKPCPHCKKPAKWEGNPWRPFCSERCRLIDLGNWASGRYSIPGDPVQDADEEDASDDYPSKEKH